MARWSLEETNDGLRLVPRRSLGSDRFTWAHLLYGRLDQVQVYIIYFPSRFDLAVDTTVIDTLRTFGTNTGPSTSVNIWNTMDPNFKVAKVTSDAIVKLKPRFQLPDGSSIQLGG